MVGTDHGGVIITGGGGAGKSTAALLCLEAGLRYLGDDYVVVALDPVATAYSLYCTAKINDDQAANFAGLLPLAQPKTGLRVHAEPEKTVFRLHPAVKEGDFLFKPGDNIGGHWTPVDLSSVS